MDPSERASAETVGPAEPFRWRAFAWWRRALAVVSVLAWVAAAFPVFGQAHGEWAPLVLLAWICLGVLLGLFALLSAFIASRAYRQQRGALYVALIQDAIVVVIVLWATQSIVRNRWGLDHARIVREVAPWLASGIVFGAEAAYLLRAALRWRFAWLGFVVLLGGPLCAVAIVPPVIAARRLEHVRPLLRYADAHWFAVPPGAKIAVGQSRAGPEHVDAITVEGEHAWWSVRATHDAAGRWIRAGSDGGPWAFAGKAEEEVGTSVSSRDDAVRLLAVCVVPDHALRFEDAPIDPVTKGVSMYRFWSPLAQGRYEVYPYGRIRFLWEQPLELDQPSGRR